MSMDILTFYVVLGGEEGSVHVTRLSRLTTRESDLFRRTCLISCKSQKLKMSEKRSNF